MAICKRNIKIVFFRFKKNAKCFNFDNFDFNSIIRKKYTILYNCLEIKS